MPSARNRWGNPSPRAEGAAGILPRPQPHVKRKSEGTTLQVECP